MFLVFVHGFMGNETSFQSMPQQLSTQLNCDFSLYCYDTKGSFDHKTKDLISYLMNLQKQDIILICHSMGGVLGVDAAKKCDFCMGVVSIDTPFFGLDPQVVMQGSRKIQSAVSSTTNYVSSVKGGWGLLAAGIGAAVAFAATQQQQLKDHLSDHFQFLGPLWDVPNRNTRFESLGRLFFHGFYATSQGNRFVAIETNLPVEMTAIEYSGTDCIETHMNMFGNPYF